MSLRPAGLIVYIVRSVRQVEVETNCEHTACLKVGESGASSNGSKF